MRDSRLILRLLGGFEARLDPGGPVSLPTRKTRALLAFLAIHAGQAIQREKLGALLWGEQPDTSARHNLRQALTSLRRALGAPGATVLRAEGETVTLDPRLVEADAVEFQRLVAVGSPEALTRAVTLYRGDLLDAVIVADTGFDEWLRGERERLHELAIEALGRLLAHQVKGDEPDAAIASAIRLLELDPLQEVVHRTLMQLFDRKGRRGAALRQYQICVEVLARELGAEPEPETRQLYQRLLRAPPPGRPLVRVDSGAWVSALPSAPAIPLIGRETELATLRALLPRPAAEAGRLALLSGEAGIGKSRLLEELLHHAEGEAVQVLIGRCHPTEQVLPLRPWVDALRGVLARVPELLEPLSPATRAELARVVPELVGAEAPPAASPESYVRLFEAMALLLLQVASRRPMLLALEDLHWADDMSVRFLGLLGRRLADLPALIVATLRDDDLDDAPVLRLALEEIAREGLGLRIGLGPLSEAGSVALVQALARPRRRAAWARAAAPRVWAASRGNPFVIVETVRALQEGRRGQRRARVPVPERVRELTAGRVTRLGTAARHVLSVAAVAGEPIGFPLLSVAAGVEEREAAELVEQLVRRRLLHAEGDRLDVPHDRVRRIIYDGLVSAHRQSLHAAVAGALERAHAGRLEEVCDRLASHYARAGNAERAIHYLVLLADRAAQGYAFEDAVRALREALGHVRELPAGARDACRLDLVFRIAERLFLMGRLRETLELVTEQRAAVERVGDPRLTASYEFWLGHGPGDLGRWSEVAPHARRALEAAERSGDAASLGRAHYLQGLERYWIGQIAEGTAHARRAIEMFEAAGEPSWTTMACWLAAVSLWQQGKLDEALAVCERLGVTARRFRDERAEAYASWTAGGVLAARGDHDEGIAACRRALALTRDPHHQAFARVFLGWTLLYTRALDEAIPLLEQGVAHFAEQGRFRPHAALYGILLAEGYLMRGDLDRASSLLGQSLAMAEAIPYRFAVGAARNGLGRLARVRGQRDEAQALFRDALGVFESVGAWYDHARTQMALAELAHAGGDRREMVRLLDEAAARFAGLGLSRWVERVRRLAERLGALALA